MNPPAVTQVFNNKLRFFRQCGYAHENAAEIPLWTSFKEEARAWQEIGRTVVERHILTGSGGEGIRIVEPGGELQLAPLYVKYEKKTHEYRLHIVKGRLGEFRVLYSQRKVARDPDGVSQWQIRNLDSGFFYQQHGFTVPVVVENIGLDLIRTKFPDVDFVALDVIYHKPTNRAFVLEGNTAPGLAGTSVEKYASFITERLI